MESVSYSVMVFSCSVLNRSDELEQGIEEGGWMTMRHTFPRLTPGASRM
jgi:hypothetical protein